MGKVAVIALALSVSAPGWGLGAVDCARFAVRRTDDITGLSFWVARREVYVRSTVPNVHLGFLVVEARGGVLVLSIAPIDAAVGCVWERDRVYFRFADGTRLDLRNTSGFNCRPALDVYFGGQWYGRGPLRQLATKRVVKLRVWYGGHFVETAVPAGLAERLQRTIGCVARKMGLLR